MRPGGSTITPVAGIAHRILRSPVGPVTLALAFALISIPFVAASFMALWSGLDWAEGWSHGARVLTQHDALALAAGSALTAAVVAGGLGGLVVRRHPRLGALVAVGLSWPVGVAMLSVTAWLADMPLGIVGAFGWDDEPLITSEPGSAAGRYAVSVFLGTATLVPDFPAIGALVLAYAARPTSRILLAVATAGVVAAAGALHVVSLLDGGTVAFLCLAVGVMAWTQLLVDPAVFATAATAPGPLDETVYGESHGGSGAWP